MIERWFASAIAFFARLVTGASIEGEEPERVSKPTVFIANHSSHADFVLLWSSLPPPVRSRTRPVAALDYWGEGPARYVAERVFRAVLIDRCSSARGRDCAHTAVHRMAAAIGEDGSLILFPEGTRSLDGRLGPFRSGLYHLCQARPGLRVVPVRLVNLNRVLPKGALIPLPLLSRVIFGPPLFLGRGESQAEFLERARRAVEELS